MYKGYKIRLYPTKEQEELMWKHIHACRFIWNYMIEYQQTRYRNNQKHLTGFQMCKHLTNLKNDKIWLKDVSNRSLQTICNDLSIAYQDFFNGLKNYPCFKSSKKAKAIYPTRAERLVFNYAYVKIEKVGRVRIKRIKNISLFSKVYNPRISYINHKWVLSFGVECESQAIETTDIPMGIDLGIKEFAVVSFGNEKLVFHNINKSKRVRTLEHKLNHIQRIVSRKNRGNGNYEKTKSILKYEAIERELYYKLVNIRTNYISQTIHSLIVLRPNKIVVESLSVKDLVRTNKQWRKDILDQCFQRFIRRLEYQCKTNGIEFIKADRWYPSSKSCSNCGNIKHNLKLSDRVYKCDHCGLEIDRDYNAAINLMRYVPPTKR